MLAALSAVVLFAVVALASAADRALPYGREDFCHATNRAWMQAHPIPEAMPYNSEYVERTLALVAEVRAIVDAARSAESPSPAQQAISDFFAGYTDLARREQRGLASLEQDLRAIESIRSRSDLAKWSTCAGREHRDLVSGGRSPAPAPFYFQYVWLDPQDTHRVVPYLGAAGLGLPDGQCTPTSKPYSKSWCGAGAWPTPSRCWRSYCNAIPTRHCRCAASCRFPTSRGSTSPAESAKATPISGCGTSACASGDCRRSNCRRVTTWGTRRVS